MTGSVVPFPQAMLPAAEQRRREKRQRAEAFRRMYSAVSAVAHELRNWNPEIARTPQWRCLREAADRMAAETVAPFKLTIHEGYDFFDVILDLACAVGDHADRLGELCRRVCK